MLSFSLCKSVQTEWTWSLKLVEKPGDTLNHLHSCRNCAKRTPPALRGCEAPPPTSAAFWGPGDPLCNREPVLGCSTSGASSFTWERALFEEMKAS